jgi:transposase-like protein
MKVKQSIPKHLRLTVEDFHKRFPNDDACLEHLKEKRYPGGIAYCTKCQQERKHHRVTGRPAYACDYCGSMISPMAGTIFEHSSTSLRLWYYAMYLMGSTRCGISAKQIQRETGVTYKTAWRMFKQIRSLLGDDDKLEGPTTVEVDEMYYGGQAKGGCGRPIRGDKQKTTVVGIVQRGTEKRIGRVKASVKADVTANTLVGMVREFVLPKSIVYTDEFPSYDGLSVRGYDHRRIRHASKVYVVGDIHTNTIEGFWSLIKTGLRGVYHSVSQKYLQTYLDEYSFRYNRRDQGNLIFTSILERVSERASERPCLPSAQNQTT